MALKWVEGFESYSGLLSFLQFRYKSFIGPASFVPGRAIGNALQFNGNTLITPTFANADTWTVGLAFRNVSLTPTNINMPIVEIRDGLTAQLTLAFNPNTRVVTLLRGATLLGTGTFVMTQGGWYYLEIKGFIDPAVGTVTVKVNTISDIVFAGNTQVTANSFANDIAFRGPAAVAVGGSFQIDDIYINDGTGAVNTTFLGDMKVEGVNVLDAGFYTDWDVSPDLVPNFQAVQVLNDGTFIQSNTVGNLDSYLTSKLNRITGGIAGVQAMYWSRNTDSTTHGIQSLIRIAGVDYLGSTLTINDTVFKAMQQIWESDPSTAVAWLVAGVNAAQFGVKLAV